MSGTCEIVLAKMASRKSSGQMKLVSRAQPRHHTSKSRSAAPCRNAMVQAGWVAQPARSPENSGRQCPGQTRCDRSVRAAYPPVLALRGYGDRPALQISTLNHGEAINTDTGVRINATGQP
jgi:hypothetical protein